MEGLHREGACPDIARRAQAATDMEEATRQWRRVFGDRFKSTANIAEATTSGIFAAAPMQTGYTFPNTDATPKTPAASPEILVAYRLAGPRGRSSRPSRATNIGFRCRAGCFVRAGFSRRAKLSLMASRTRSGSYILTNFPRSRLGSSHRTKRNGAAISMARARCAFSSGRTNWVSGASGADVLRSAYDLLIVENPLGEGGVRAPSEHRVGELQAYDWGANPVLIGAGCAERIRTNLC